MVAVKKMKCSRQDEKQFRAEISSLGNIQHANLVRLQGFCAEGSRRLLVYDYMPKGSLNSILFTGSSKSKREVVDWKTRFEIALGTARGLLYLHEECRDHIIHCDVKPENILLDGDLSPKLVDFGLAKLVGRDFSHVPTTTRGTRGYLAPEWISGLPITPKVDVYSFALLCIQEDEEVRPRMMQVVQMLEGKVEPQTPQVMDRPVDRSDTSRINYSHVSS
ncbi:hypothetical protein SUGI_0257240 [Cryptomeria japonica]|nr:hypothetical protein SUGI_0257240 [Cryptomeria japonica]